MSSALKIVSELCSAYKTADLATQSDIRSTVLERQGSIFNAKMLGIAYDAINESSLTAQSFIKAKRDFLQFWYRESANRSLDKSDWWQAYDILNSIFGGVYMTSICTRMRQVVVGDISLKGTTKRLTRNGFKTFAFSRGFVKNIPKNTILSAAMEELIHAPSMSLEKIVTGMGGTFEKDMQPFQRKWIKAQAEQKAKDEALAAKRAAKEAKAKAQDRKSVV